MSKRQLDIVSKWIFRPGTIIGCLLIGFYLVDHVTEMLDRREILSAPATDFFVYESISSVKDEFALGEPVRMRSQRTTKKELPIGGKDTLFCDVGDGFTLVSSKDRENPKPAAVANYRGDWFYEGELPRNPIGTYIEAECYIRSDLHMCVKGICKRQRLVSNNFFLQDN